MMLMGPDLPAGRGYVAHECVDTVRNGTEVRITVRTGDPKRQYRLTSYAGRNAPQLLAGSDPESQCQIRMA